MASSSVPAASASAAADIPSGVLPVGPVAPSDVDVEMSGSDSEWIQIKDEPVTVHDQAVKEEQETTPFLAEAQLIDSDDKPLFEKLKEMEEALAKLSVDKEKKKLAFDDEAEIIEISPRKSVWPSQLHDSFILGMARFQSVTSSPTPFGFPPTPSRWRHGKPKPAPWLR